MKSLRMKFSILKFQKQYTFPKIKASIFNDVVTDCGNYDKFLLMCKKSEIT